jgi:hypothetical protein
VGELRGSIGVCGPAEQAGRPQFDVAAVLEVVA